MFLLVKSSGAQVKMLREIALKMQELSPFVNKKLGFRSIFGHQRPSLNLKKEAYLRAQNSQKLRPKNGLTKRFQFLDKSQAPL